MAPEAVLRKNEELGPWTDLYSAAAVFFCLLTDGKTPEDVELAGARELVSAYSRLLLHEKEATARQVNEILGKGLAALPKVRYQNTGEMLKDIQKLRDIMSGAIRIPVAWEREGQQTGMEPPKKRWGMRTALAAGALVLAAGGFLGGRASLLRQEAVTEESTKLDLYQFPLETDDSVVLTQQDVRYPLVDNRMDVQVQTSTAVRVMLKDYTHKRDLSEVISTYSLFCFYTGKG